MIATVVNALAVVVGSLVGLLFRRRVSRLYRGVVFDATGVVSVIIGISMAMQSQRVLYLAIALVLGGLIGTAMRIEDGILWLGSAIQKLLPRPSAAESTAAPAPNAAPTGPPPSTAANEGRGSSLHDESGSFAGGFLNASVLFCVGALTIIGSFQAGVSGDYTLIFTKSVMDGFMAVLLTAAMGLGVAFSALTILVYQGGLTLGATLVAPFVNPLMLSEISGVGGAMVIMIGLNLIGVKQFKTANFLPALVVVLAFVLADPYLGVVL